MLIFLAAFLTATATGFIVAPLIIASAKRLKLGQAILCYVEQHKEKEGVPTMGGWIFILSCVVGTVIFCRSDNSLAIFCLLILLAYGLLGFLDDFIKLKLKRNLGLKAYQKIISQLVIAAIASWYLYKNSYIGSEIYLPFFDESINLGWGYIPFCMFIFIALSNSVNLTDGLDGLAGTTSVLFFLTFFVIITIEMLSADNLGRTFCAEELKNVLVFIVSLVGGLTAFLWFNSHSAKLFMGDTGSLALGGVGSAIALICKNPLIILSVGIMFIVSSISVIVQVVSFKIRKKRVLLMAPLHHHLEMKGHQEAEIVGYYSIITVLGGIIGLIVM